MGSVKGGAMKLKDTVLDNASEANTFHTLELKWSPKFKIFPSLPLLKVFQIDSDDLTTKELWYLQKSNVDYTVCLLNNKPILSIEFDGVRGGFSRDGVYFPEHKIVDQKENHRMDLLLKVAKEVNYPIMVISYEELINFDEEDSLTILYGIIRQLFAHEEFAQNIKRTDGEGHEDIEGILSFEKYKDFLELKTPAEKGTESTMDPIVDRALLYQQRCTEFGLNKHRLDYLIDPPLFGVKNIYDEEIIQSQIKAMKQIVRVGCRVMIENSQIVIAQSVWIYNSEFFEVNPLSMAKNIAQYLAYKRLYALLMLRSKNGQTKHSLS